MWKHFVDPDRLQTTMWCMRLACWIPKVTNTYPQYVTLIALPTAAMISQWCHNVTFNVHFLSCVNEVRSVLCNLF